jgi:D-alanyl-D-alanine carboxypeptidase
MSHHRIFLIAFFFAITLSTGQTSAQQQDFSKLSQYLDSLESYQRFMGTVLVASEGKPVYERSVGYADLATGQKSTTQTHYRIGSITKMFTTVLVMQAVESGKLRLDQKLSEFYPQIPNADKITLGMMLQHRSGIFNFTNRLDYDFFRSQPQTESKLLDMIIAGGSVFEPDTKADYSNSNFVLLTFILEKTSGQTYQSLLEKGIFQRLGLSDTYIFGPIDPSKKNEARSYGYAGEWKVDREADSSVPLGAGNLTSTTGDLNVFIHALFSGKLISTESLALMKEIKDGFGRGLFSFPYYQQRSFGHTGGIDGFRSFLAHFPEDQVTISVLSNATNFNSNDLLLALLDSYYGKEWQLPEFKAKPVSVEMMQRYIGTYSSTQIPLVLVFSEKDGNLAVQPSGQPLTVLELTGANRFEFKQAGAVFTFDPEQNQVTLNQAGQTFLFKKK